jgi:selenide,water dikinase
VFGQIAAANALSDLYAMGASPVTALNIVGFPDDRLELEILGHILRGGADRVRQAGAVIAGGHTVRDSEIKYGLSATGMVSPDQLITNAGARPGDVLVLTKPLGTGFVTTALKAEKCPPDILDAAVASMVTLNAAAARAAVNCGVKAATDVTGFGLAGHACELAQESEVTIELLLDQVPLLPGAAELVQRGFFTRASASNREFAGQYLRIEGQPNATQLEFLFDPQTSGGLLMSVPAAHADELVGHLRESETQAASVLGKVIAREDAALIVKS